MLMKDSYFLYFKYLNFDFYTLKVPFIRSWPVYIYTAKWYGFILALGDKTMILLLHCIDRKKNQILESFNF